MAESPPSSRSGSSPYDSRTEAAEHTTAHRLHKHYRHGQAVSAVADKRAARPHDGHITSNDYAAGSRFLPAGGDGKSLPAATLPERLLDIGFHHPLEDWLARDLVRRLLGCLTRCRPGRMTIIEEVLAAYGNPRAPLGQRIKYWPLHKFIDRMKGSVTRETFRRRISEHVSTMRGLVVTARSIAEFGLTVPQRFAAPLFAVWNFTNKCNLRCRHCYQDSARDGLANELTLPEKLDLLEQVAAQHLPMIAFAGGEPTISPDLLPVLRRCQRHGIHTSLATNGSTLTPRLAAELAAAGVKYVEVSLDSVHPPRHDGFRGQPGMWHRSVRGMRYVVRQEGLRLGIAMCIHQGNFAELDDMLQFALDIGASCFAHFNFIPVGRGLEMTHGDLTPQQREHVLRTLNEWMQKRRIGIMSTAPQLGRVCLAHAPLEGQQSCAHTGAGSGEKARVVARYLGGCGAGRTYVCFEPNGNVTPCVYLPHRVLGNIRQRRFIDIFRNNEFADLLCDRTRLTHHCEVCRFKSYCGGCRARADGYFGALNAGDPGCLFNEKHWQELVRQRPLPGVASEPGTVPAAAGEPIAVRGYDGCASTWAPDGTVSHRCHSDK